jgi:imidazolonepropionase-like amidohydrolase
MNLNLNQVVSFVFFLFSAAQLVAQISAPVIVIKAGWPLDPRSGNVLSPAAVLIEDAKIKEVGSPTQGEARAPNDVKRIDLGSATLLPGLIDGHTHLFLDIVRPPHAEAQRHENGIFAPGLLLAIAAEQIVVISPAARASFANSAPGLKQQYDQLVARVLKSGVKFAAGSEMCWFYPAVFVNLHRAGMSALDVIRAITSDAAEMLGWQDRIGTIEPRKFADLIAVAGDPVADITELQHVRFVMRDGEVIKNDVGPK